MKQELAQEPGLPGVLSVPRYLQEVYWWAYVHPNAIRVFERQWLVNAILWGNFSKLRDAAIRSGMRTLLGDGKLKILRGRTTPNEISKFAQSSTFDPSTVGT